MSNTTLNSRSSQSSQYASAQSRRSVHTPLTGQPPQPPGVQFVPNPMIVQPRALPNYFQGPTETDFVIKPDFDFENGFKRAVKVFVMSYPEIVDSIPLTHSRKLEEYVKEMATLYKVKTPYKSFLSKIYEKAQKEKYNIVITCKKVVGVDRHTKSLLKIVLKDKECKLGMDNKNEGQPYAPVIISVKFKTFVKLRSDANRRIVFTIESLTSAHPKQEKFKTFDLIIADTHPEGF